MLGGPKAVGVEVGVGLVGVPVPVPVLVFVPLLLSSSKDKRIPLKQISIHFIKNTLAEYTKQTHLPLKIQLPKPEKSN